MCGARDHAHQADRRSAGRLGRTRGSATGPGYLAKYVSKNIGDERVPRLHRYEVGQGFQPVKVPLSGDSDLAVIAEASERMGGEPIKVWRSSEREGWRGAPASWCAWAGLLALRSSSEVGLGNR